MENSEISFEFSEKLKFIAWIEYKGIRAVNTAYAERVNKVIKQKGLKP